MVKEKPADKIYVYYDGTAEGSPGRPRVGFWCKDTGAKADKDIETILFKQYPACRHKEEVYITGEQIAGKVKYEITDKDQLRRLSYDTLVDIMQFGTSENARLAAAREILDRVDGKPLQSVNQTVQGSTHNTVTVKVEYVPSINGREVIDVIPKEIEG
jgi:hypothetical protein